MSRRNKQFFGGKATVESPKNYAPGDILAKMKDGREYEALLEVQGALNLDVRAELALALRALEVARGRPAIIYAGNVIRQMPGASVSIDLADHLPFSELVGSIDAGATAVDVVLTTPGGLAQQVSHFVNRLRPRFKDVAFIVPYMAMSAGTIWALSGNEIWMDERAYLGPIDPQVPGRDGRYVPAQALLVLLKRIQDTGAAALKQAQHPPWSDVQILRQIDAKEIGNVLSLTQYSIQLSASYLETHKFRDWTVHSSTGATVTAAEKTARALDVATKLCSHEQWRTHSHGLARDVVEKDLQLQIGHPEATDTFGRALRRLGALMYWLFENTQIAKIYLSQSYGLFRQQPRGTPNE